MASKQQSPGWECPDDEATEAADDPTTPTNSTAFHGESQRMRVQDWIADANTTIKAYGRDFSFTGRPDMLFSAWLGFAPNCLKWQPESADPKLGKQPNGVKAWWGFAPTPFVSLASGPVSTYHFATSLPDSVASRWPPVNMPPSQLISLPHRGRVRWGFAPTPRGHWNR